MSRPLTERNPFRMSITVVIFSFYNGKNITLKASKYRNLKKKAEHLKENLIELKQDKNN